MVQLACLEPGTMIHGIRVLDNSLFPNLDTKFEKKSILIAVFGQKETRTFKCTFGEGLCTFQEEWVCEISNDWIWDVMLGCCDDSNSLQLIRITAHNVVEIWDYASRSLSKLIRSPDNSILYSSSLYYSHARGLLAACGTVFNQVCW